MPAKKKVAAAKNWKKEKKADAAKVKAPTKKAIAALQDVDMKAGSLDVIIEACKS